MLKIGVFGVGHLGKFHVSNWQNIEGISIVGFYDPNDEHAKEAIEKFGLGTFFWETIERKYHYKSAHPTVKDYLLKLIQDNFERSILHGKPLLNKEASLFVNRWKENTKASPLYSAWSHQLENDL